MTYIFVSTHSNEDNHTKDSIEDSKRVLEVVSIALIMEVDCHQTKTPTHKEEKKDGE